MLVTEEAGRCRGGGLECTVVDGCVGGNQGGGGGCKGLAGAGSKKKNTLTCCSAGSGSGLALGFGVGGGVASERARVWGHASGCHPRPDSAQMCESDTENGYWGSGGYVSM